MDSNAKYPEWTEKPFKLTIDEIENPQTVLDDFFSWYSLLEVRKNLREILMTALTVEDAPASNYYLERLTEAASIILEHYQSTENIAKIQAEPVISQH